jgi:hypothetical protein
MVDDVVRELLTTEWWLQRHNPCCLCGLDRLVDCYVEDLNVTAHVKRKPITAHHHVNKENTLPEYFDVYICCYTTTSHIPVYVRV